MTLDGIRTRIRTLCRREGYSQATLADAAGLHRQSISLFLARGAASGAVLEKLGVERTVSYRVRPGGVLERAIERALPRRETSK